MLERTGVRNYAAVIQRRPIANRPSTVTPPGEDGDDLLAASRSRSSNRTARGVEDLTKGSTVDRDKALEMALANIDKQFGKGSVMKMGDKGSMAIETVPTGALALDLALGIGGLPRGRVVEIYGPESSGKSTLAMHVV